MFNEEEALAELIRAKIFFVYDTPNPFWEGSPKTIQLQLNCNDLWFWACADSEPITLEDLPKLYKEFKKDKKWGADKFICIKKNLAPQKPIREAMKVDGSWDESLELLPKPEDLNVTSTKSKS
jgi:hypothetical protein